MSINTKVILGIDKIIYIRFRIRGTKYINVCSRTSGLNNVKAKLES